MTFHSGTHFLQIPGPSPVPERILRAIDQAVIDHRGPAFAELGFEVLHGIREIFQTRHPVIIYPASGTGAWEAALVNTLSPGDRVLMPETGHFSSLWQRLATRLGLEVEILQGDWRHGADPEQIGRRLREDAHGAIRAVCVVHNETSTGVTSPVSAVREAIDRAGHPALLMVDTISSLGSIDYRADDWRVDVTVGGSQKGLMLPPGLSFNAVSPRALKANRTADLRRGYWDWQEMLAMNADGYFPYTPATNLLFGLREAIRMLQEEGLPTVFARHARLAEATRAAVQAWGLEVLCRDPACYSPVLTAVVMPGPLGEAEFRRLVLERFDMSLGAGLGRLKDTVFRIGHLGATGDLTLLGALAGVEMGLACAGVPHQAGGVQAAMRRLALPD